MLQIVKSAGNIANQDVIFVVNGKLVLKLIQDHASRLKSLWKDLAFLDASFETFVDYLMYHWKIDVDLGVRLDYSTDYTFKIKNAKIHRSAIIHKNEQKFAKVALNHLNNFAFNLNAHFLNLLIDQG